MFADEPGAVAAPTAGLHFTPALMRAARGRRRDAASGDAACRRRHVPAGQERGHRTTTGCTRNGAGSTPRRPTRSTPRARAAGASSPSARRRCGCSKARPTRTGGCGRSRARPTIFITPGYRFRAVDALFTNFHLPRSTLLMLVSAFAGRERALAAYAHAIAAGYRFYSYGDACLFERVRQNARRSALGAACRRFAFDVLARDGAARLGEIVTPRGTIRTPAFMPVGTAGDRQGDVSRTRSRRSAPTSCSATPIT